MLKYVKSVLDPVLLGVFTTRTLHNWRKSTKPLGPCITGERQQNQYFTHTKSRQSCRVRSLDPLLPGKNRGSGGPSITYPPLLKKSSHSNHQCRVLLDPVLMGKSTKKKVYIVSYIGSDYPDPLCPGKNRGSGGSDPI